MEWKMHYDENDQIIYTKTSGVLEIKSAEIMRHEGIALAKKHNCHRGLLDHSEIMGDELTTMDIYNLPKKYNELGVPRTFRLALVVPKRFMENLKFYETVCHNNGYSMSVFFDRETALAWLNNVNNR